MKQTTSALSQKIIDTGKYYEFKEKYLMRKRIKELSIDNKEERKIIITTGGDDSRDKPVVENTIISDSEFRVIGVRKDVTPINTSVDDDDNYINDYSVIEISDINEGFKLYEDNEVTIKDNPLKDNLGFDIPKKRIFFDDVGHVSENKEEKEEIKIIESKTQEKKDKTISYKKDKMRFGFTDNE
jgi:hypothetical protein